jgi:fumarylpyruvate hydrolase
LASRLFKNYQNIVPILLKSISELDIPLWIHILSRINKGGVNMTYVFQPPQVVTLPVHGIKERFPVHLVYCVGRNYASNAFEMGDNPGTQDVHFEIELVVGLKSGGKHIPAERALEHVYGYAVGLDMTRRDLQEQAKKMGRPWEAGKSFELSAPCSEIVPIDDIGHPDRGAIWLEVNGERRQQGDLRQLIWKVPEVISFLSGLFRLAPGDLIFTGTPCCVGPTVRGDSLRGYVEKVGELKINVV